MSAYPIQYESDVVLRDGSTLRLRPLREEDGRPLQELLSRLSTEGQRFRFFRAANQNGFALVAESNGRLSGAASYTRDSRSPDRAEVAFAIADALQGRGVGTRMLETLAAIARDHHIRFFDAYVQQTNDRMMRVFLDSGFEVERRLEGGVFHVSFSIQPTAAYESRAAERSQAAATASMKAFFEPEAVVVVGANRQRGKIGSEILHNLLAGGFTGRLFAVHPSATSIDGVPAYPRVTAIPGHVDLAVISVPCGIVSSAVDDCIAKGVKALVVISAGFGETGPAGRAVEQTILEKVRRAGIRMIGPNCMGIINTDPAVRLNATFSPTAPVEGRVGFSTQSGALGLAILDYVHELNLGVSTFVSVGNKADVSGNDLIQYWADDARTDVILLYLESFGNPHRFAQIARRVAQRKPIVAVKAGRSQAGARAATSHTGALAASDAVVDALFRQAGIIRTGTLEELFDVATLLAHQPLPAGPRVGILTNAGGPGILAADACEASGLELSSLSDATVVQLQRFLPSSASVGNPVDMLASATADQYRQTTTLMLADEQIDSLVVIFIPPLITKADEVAKAIVDGAAGTTKPVLANFISARGAPPELASIPAYRFPESAVTALAHATTYGAWRRQPKGSIPQFRDIRTDVLREIVDGALIRGEGWLTPMEAERLLNAVGITTASTRLVATDDEALSVAREIGYPVALKAVGPEILHKTDVGGVMLDIADDGALRSACQQLRSRVGQAMTAMLVQRMVPDGVELLIGAVVDPTFGTLVACGSGGVLVDLLHDTAFRIHPLTDVDARDMLESLRVTALLRGYRGRAPADEGAVVDVLLRVSALLEICPEVHELDINPLTVFERGECAVDARLRVSRRLPHSTSRRISY